MSRCTSVSEKNNNTVLGAYEVTGTMLASKAIPLTRAFKATLDFLPNDVSDFPHLNPSASIFLQT